MGPQVDWCPKGMGCRLHSPASYAFRSASSTMGRYFPSPVQNEGETARKSFDDSYVPPSAPTPAALLRTALVKQGQAFRGPCPH